MTRRKKWAVVGAATALGVSGAVATAAFASPLTDRATVADLDTSAVQLSLGDNASPQSADSPAGSAMDSAASATEGQDDVASAQTADSPGETADSSALSAVSPAPAPAAAPAPAPAPAGAGRARAGLGGARTVG